MDKIGTGNLIKEARIKKDYTQAELGNLVGVSNKAVSRWEKGESFPDVGILENLADILDIKIENIVTGSIKEDADFATELVRTVKIQQGERKQKLIIDVLLSVPFLLSLLLGYLSLGFSRYITGEAGIYYFILVLILSFLMLAFAFQCRGRVYIKEKMTLFEKVVVIVSAFWSIWIFIIFVLSCEGYFSFNMPVSSIGPFTVWQLRGLFVINLLFIAVQFIKSTRNDCRISDRCFVSIGFIGFSSVFGAFMYDMSSINDMIEKLILRIFFVFLIMGLSLLIKNFVSHVFEKGDLQ